MVNNTSPSVATSRFPVAGLTLAVDTHNPGGDPALLFAHGFGQTRGAWSGTAGALAQAGCRCVTFDTRGHGESDRVADGDYHMDQFADDMLRMAGAQPEPPILVGASMGGLLGIVLAGEV
ncbi:MAG: alpha/beta fold hydrolase, partial [Rhodanobacter sp.]